MVDRSPSRWRPNRRDCGRSSRSRRHGDLRRGSRLEPACPGDHATAGSGPHRRSRSNLLRCALHGGLATRGRCALGRSDRSSWWHNTLGPRSGAWPTLGTFANAGVTHPPLASERDLFSAGAVAAHHHAGPRGRVTRRGRADAGLRARHRPSRRARAGRHRHDGVAPGGCRPRSRLRPLSNQDFDLAGIDIIINTHLHFDHCGGNHLFAGKPIYVQRRELDDARSEHDYTIREWVEAPGVRYVPVDETGYQHRDDHEGDDPRGCESSRRRGAMTAPFVRHAAVIGTSTIPRPAWGHRSRLRLQRASAS